MFVTFAEKLQLHTGQEIIQEILKKPIRSISICAACALDHLPRLIADAVSGEIGETEFQKHLHYIEKRILLAFGRAAIYSDKIGNKLIFLKSKVQC